jgi:hypothetical protein
MSLNFSGNYFFLQETEMKTSGIKIPEPFDSEERAPQYREISEMESTFEKLEQEVLGVKEKFILQLNITNFTLLKKRNCRLVRWKKGLT